MRARAFLNFAVAVATASLLSFGAQADDAYTIGVTAAMTGPAAATQAPVIEMLRLYVDGLNAKGGINGRKLELVLHDDRTDPTEAARGASKLIRQDGVVAIIGSTTGNTSLAFLPIAARGEVPVLAMAATTSVTAPDSAFFPWSFRATVTTGQMTQGVMDAVVVKNGLKRVAVVYSEDAFGREGADLVKNLAQTGGKYEMVEAVSVPINAIDLTTAATRVRNANPEFAYIISSAVAIGSSFVRSARQVGYEGKIGGTVILAQKAFLDAAGPAADGVVIGGFNNWDDPLPKEVELGKTMSAAGIPPAGYGEVLGANCILVLAEAIRRCGANVTGARIRDAMETITDFDGTPMNGKVNFSKTKHDGYGPEALVITRVEKGKLITVR